jgi:LytS/YehU family sensor histidine kinase
MENIRAQMTKLEKAALKKQMNPHFIFNSLNSIQAYIMENEKILAMEYLSKFAMLIRMTLNAANEEKVSVQDEIRMLDHYLSLEKLRFQERFDYTIRIIDKIDSYSTFIPPMLIQPVAENAVIHGMKGKTGNGKILIEFRQTTNHLIVEVRDNGPGFEENIQNDIHRKAYGMEITRKRLLLDTRKNMPLGDLQIERTQEGWTCVRLIIPPSA